METQPPPHFYRGKTAECIKMSLGKGDFVFDGDPAPPPNFFRSIFIVTKRLDGSMALGIVVGVSPDDCVTWGPIPSPKRGRSQFSAHFYCGQTAGCIKMPLGTEVGLGPDDIVLDGDRVPPPRKRGGAPSPIFGPRSL